MSLEVISVNLWQILISLCNLVLLFLILKRFLYKPVKRTLEKRRGEIDGQYESAKKAEDEAEENRRLWEDKMNTAKAEADGIVRKASESAKAREASIVEDAKKRASVIVKQAENEAMLEKKKAESEIKKEIVNVSSSLSEKVLGREINEEDHRALIDSFIDEIGEADESDR